LTHTNIIIALKLKEDVVKKSTFFQIELKFYDNLTFQSLDFRKYFTFRMNASRIEFMFRVL